MCIIIQQYLFPFREAVLGLGGEWGPLDAVGLLLAEGDVSLCRGILEPALAVGALHVVWVGRSWLAGGQGSSWGGGGGGGGGVYSVHVCTVCANCTCIGVFDYSGISV